MSGLDLGDRQVLEQKYSGCDPPCLLDSSDGRWAKNYLNLVTFKGRKPKPEPTLVEKIIGRTRICKIL